MNEANHKNTKNGVKKARGNTRGLEVKANLDLKKKKKTEGAAAFDFSIFLNKARIWIKKLRQKISPAISGSLKDLKNIEHKAEVGFKEFENKAGEKIGKAVENVKNWEHRAAGNVKVFEHEVAEKVKGFEAKAEAGLKDFGHKVALGFAEFKHEAAEKMAKLAKNEKKPIEAAKQLSPQKKIEAVKPMPAKPVLNQPVSSVKKAGLIDLFRKMKVGNPMSILIIEDEQILAQVMKEKFEKAGFSVDIAPTGEKGLSMIKSSEPDIIVLDLMLPQISGIEVLKEIKADNQTKLIPVIVVSNLADEENIKKTFSMGVVDYFVKANHPVNEIVEKVKAVLLKSK